VPGTVGPPLPGVEAKIGPDRELLVRSPAQFRGYWKDDAATARVLSSDGWLATGDIADIVDGRLCIRGRIKEMIVLSIGEKLNPIDIEAEILRDPLFLQVAVLGSGRPFLVAFVVLNQLAWRSFAQENDLVADRPNEAKAEEMTLARISARLSEFPRFAQIRAVHLTLQLWTIEAGLLTPTLKVKRDTLQAQFKKEIDALYSAPRINSDPERE
jgi:long-chain acyl-CoA synthetase